MTAPSSASFDDDIRHLDAVATLRHELRTPLTGIAGVVAMLLDTTLTDEQRELVMALHSAGEHLGNVLDRTLTGGLFGAIDAPAMNVAFDLPGLVQEIVTLFSANAALKTVTLETCLDPALPSLVRGDPTPLRQALANLVSNAVKFTETGGVSVAAASDADGTVRFTVTDSGPGFNAAAWARRTPRADGSGMGLSLTRKLVATMGGRLAVSSVAGTGSTCSFVLSLPAIGTVAAERLNDNTVRVLLAEDDVVSRQVLIHYARRLGHDLVPASCGRDALEVFRVEHFDVVLLDRCLPDVDGIEMMRTIRAIDTERGTHTPIIAVTATGTAADRARCLAAGMDDYLSKPIALADLALRLDHWSRQASRPVASVL